MLSKSSKYEFLAEPFHCDFTHRLLLGHLGNHLLNAADFHSDERDFGIVYLNNVNYTWVLSRLAIEMNEMPCEYDKFTVETWIENVYRFFTNRNFSIEGKDGKVYGHSRSVWAMIDKDSRQPVDLLSVKDGAIQNYVISDKECPMEKPSRVKMTDKAQLVDSVIAKYSDLDINGHVNSVKYIEHVLDLFPKEVYATKRIKRFEIAYVAEAHYGDTLNFYLEQIDENEYCIAIKKNESDSSETIEVCRSKVKFVND
jgi:medium-chain acyl-[acyl-carrier-protein] hydrolase